MDVGFKTYVSKLAIIEKPNAFENSIVEYQLRHESIEIKRFIQ